MNHLLWLRPSADALPMTQRPEKKHIPSITHPVMKMNEKEVRSTMNPHAPEATVPPAASAMEMTENICA